MKNLAQALQSSADDVAGLGANASDIEALDDRALLSAQEKIGAHRHHLDTYAAWVAGEIARRSRHELGYAGLSQRTGFLTPEALIQSVSRSTRAEAAKFVHVGTMMAEAVECEPSVDGPAAALWRTALAGAVASGEISVDAAESICKGLGVIDDAVNAEQLGVAVERLITASRELNADQLFRRARELRDELDEAGIARRERERRDQRYHKHFMRPDGMYAGSYLLDPEGGSVIAAAFDAILSPRRGGPRFVDPVETARAEQLVADERTSEQIAADALVDIFRLAMDADPGTLFGKRRPAVRVLVTEESLRRQNGHGRLEGQLDPVSLETVERHLCDSGFVGVKFDDDGQCVNVGRDQRLFTERQRVGLAARDGGCLFPDCDRPPSWCEAHHIDQWHRDRGKTDIADGILLCRRHHMLVHNNHWQILREGGAYWLRPPRSIDPTQELIPMPGNNPLIKAVRAVGTAPAIETVPAIKTVPEQKHVGSVLRTMPG